MEIIKIFDKDSSSVLSQKASEIPVTPEGFKEAKMIADKLIKTLTPLMPAAGLAAPQIGISRRIFIYSWDRSLENMEIAINPKIIQSDSEVTWGPEACFSTIQENGVSKAAFVSRATSITVEYVNVRGETVKRKLIGFAAKVFQHEYDHLDGIENISKQGAEIKTFLTKAELMEFMKSVKRDDSFNYIKPEEVDSTTIPALVE